MIEVPPKATRWSAASPRSCPSTASTGAALLLHVAVCTALLTIVRLPAVPTLPETQTMALVFAPPQSLSPELPAPAAMPDPSPPAEIPMAPAVPPAPRSPPPPPSAETPLQSLPPASEAPGAPSALPEPPLPHVPTETKPPDASLRNAQPPVAHKMVLRARPVARPRIAKTPTADQPHPADAPISQPTSRSPVAEAPIASDWQHALAAWLAAHKTYPDEARRRGKEGNVVLRFMVDRSGHVLDVVLERSAGSLTLDTAAEAMIRNATLPPFSAGMAQDAVTITVQIRYALTN